LKEAQDNMLEITKTLQEKDKQLDECNANLSKTKQMVEEQTKSLNSSSRFYVSTLHE